MNHPAFVEETSLSVQERIQNSLRGLAVLITFGLLTTPSFAQSTGRLVVIGGALDPMNQTVFDAFLEGVTQESQVGVVPLASGVPERSGPLTVQDIQQFAVNPSNVFDTNLTNKDPAYAKEQACADKLHGCQTIWFTGGDQSRIVAAMRPDRQDTVSYQATRDVLSGGGTIGGTSAGAAMMSDPMIRSGRSEDALLLGATEIIDGPGVCVGQGMGFFPYGITDQHFLRRGRFGRLLIAVEATEEAQFGFGVSENRALVVDLGDHWMRAVGDQAVTIIDSRSMTRQNHDRRDARVHLLGDGDQFNGKSFELKPAPSRVALATDRPDIGVPIRFADMWDRHVVAEMIKAVAANPAQPALSQDANFDYSLSADERTRFYVGGENAGLMAVNVRLDITARSGIEERIAKRKGDKVVGD
ncbi:MAG: cyanophycinase [Planctomycetota bacterium]